MAETQAPAQNGATPQLQDAPQDITKPNSAPLNYRAEFLIETQEGFHVLFAGEQLTPRDAMVWIRNASSELAKQGFKPVRRDVQVQLAAAPRAGNSQPAGSSGDEAAEVVGNGSDGRPPACSLHGAMVWREGTIAEGKPRAGQHYAFWGCKERNCKLTFHPKTSS